MNMRDSLGSIQAQQADRWMNAGDEGGRRVIEGGEQAGEAGRWKHPLKQGKVD